MENSLRICIFISVLKGLNDGQRMLFHGEEKERAFLYARIFGLSLVLRSLGGLKQKVPEERA